jgi:hypothetical protein
MAIVADYGQKILAVLFMLCAMRMIGLQIIYFFKCNEPEDGKGVTSDTEFLANYYSNKRFPALMTKADRAMKWTFLLGLLLGAHALVFKVIL